MKLWAKELNAITATPGILIEFEDSMKLERFKNFAAKRRLQIHAINGDLNLIVVDIESEKEAYEFVNSN